MKTPTRVSAGIMGVAVLLAVLLSSCVSAPDEPMALKTEKPFASGGSIEMQLDGGDYEIRAAPGDSIRVSFGGNTASAMPEVTTTGAHANVAIKDTPHDHFKAMIEVPKTSDIVLHLSGGNLHIGPIGGNKDIDSKAGNVTVAVGDTNDYANVDASVSMGNLAAGPFGGGESGAGNHLTWSGHGKYTLRANLGAGNLELQNK